ncbi:MAG: TolC family protein, partial [Gemmataceae bacterium]
MWMTTKKRLILSLGALTLAGFTGCKQQLFIEPADYQEKIAAGLPPRLESSPHEPVMPGMIKNPAVPPATVMDPTRPAKNLSLKEAIAIAAEQGNLGAQGGLQNGGFQNDNLVNFAGRGVSGTDSIRALVLDPAVVGADMERSLSKFDARWITSMTWNKQDQATLSLQQSFSNGDQAALSSTLAKPLPTGGVAGITFSTQYQNLSNPPQDRSFVALTTSYTPRLQFIFEQPLMQAFGVEVNQLSSQHPGSLLIQGLRPSGGQTTEGILITRIRYEQQRAEFDRQINEMLKNVELAYWNLYAEYYNLYAQEEILRQSFELVIILNKRLDAGLVTKQDIRQTEAQYYQFRFAVLDARGRVLQAERSLRGLLGMDSYSDGVRLVPTDTPTLAPFSPDFATAANDALTYRPELLLARQDLKFRQLDLVLQKNQRRPDLRFFASYDMQGLGSRLDGPETRRETTTNPNTGLPQTTTVNVNALDSFMNNQFNSWQLGLRLDVPLGFRDANAAVRQGQLNLARSYYQLHDSERKAVEVVIQVMRDLDQRQQLIAVAREQRIAYQEVLKLNKTLIETGQWNVNTLFNLLQ